MLWVRDTLRHTVITLGVLNVFRSEANGRDLSNNHDAVNEETNYECFWVVETSVTDPLVFKDICAGVDTIGFPLEITSEGFANCGTASPV